MTTPAPEGALPLASALRTALVTTRQNKIKISAFKICPDQPALSISKTTTWSRSLSTSHDFASLQGLPACAFAPYVFSPTVVGRILPEPQSDQVTPNPLSKLPWLPSPSEEKPWPSGPHTSPTPALPPPPLTCSSYSGLGLFVFLHTKNACRSTEYLVCVILLREKHAGCGFLKTHYMYLQRLFGSFSDKCC